MWQIVLVVGILVLTFGGLGGYILFQALDERKTRLALQQAGTTTEATVVSRRSESHTYHTKNGTRTRITYYVTYRYDTPQGTFTHEESVGLGDYDTFKEGTKVNITYLAGNPDVMRQASEINDMSGSNTMRWLAYVMLGIAGVIAIGGGGIIINFSIMAAQAAQVANATATAVASAKRAELTSIRTVITPRLPAWQGEKGSDVHQLNPFDASGGPESVIKEVDYGYCSFGNNFYTYVWTSVSATQTEWSADGFGYYPDAKVPYLCHPEQWIVRDLEDMGDGWHLMSATRILSSSSQ